MHDLCMAIKTISLELDAYEKLRRARLTPKESFSNVVRRARWAGISPAAGKILEDLKGHPEILLPEAELGRLQRRSRSARRRTAWDR